MANIFKLIDISEDPLYLKGKLEGIESLIINTDFDDARIAFLMAVPLDLVLQTRQKLAKKKNKNGQ
jgi:hypothetical protein